MNPAKTLMTAACVADGTGLHESPGAILLSGNQILAAGTVQQIGDVPDATRIDLPRHVVMPGLVNAHTHLDLSHIGPLPYGGDFAQWLDRILAERAAMTQDGIGASVQLGAKLAQAGGTVYVGDIAGAWSLEPIHALRQTTLAGVSFLEVFGIGVRQAQAVPRMTQLIDDLHRDMAGVRLGISPHAPYTCGMEVYAAAATLGLPIATHLAESLEELQFASTGGGAFAELLQRIGVWDESITGIGCHPVEALADVLGSSPSLAAHLNYVDDACLHRLSQTSMSIAYCPRASAYFGHPHGEHPPHRYQEMLDFGINVALGTDSLVCLDTSDRISVLDEMRYLYRRDAADAHRLLRMATINGARALGFDESLVTFTRGPVTGIIAVQGTSLAQALEGDDAPTWLLQAPCLSAS